MTPEQQHWSKLAAYLSNQLSDEEKEEVDLWRMASKENEEIFNEASKIWESSGVKLRMDQPGEDDQWQELQSLITREKERRKFAFFPSGSMWLKIAASFVLLGCLTYVVVLRKAKPKIAAIDVEVPADNELPVKDTTIAAGDVVIAVYLPDSSKVWLNAQSSITYTVGFRKGRKTKIKGEGYFEVMKDESNPFQIETQDALVQVVGTKFNLKTDDTYTELAVTEGAVNFSDLNANTEKVLVKAGETAVRRKGAIEKVGRKKDVAGWRRKNNPEYERESTSPESFLNVKFSWRKNSINQSVVEGTIENNATLASYKNILLKITYTKPNGRSVTTRFKVLETVMPGDNTRYQKRLFDILTHTRNLTVKVEKAEVYIPAN